MHLNSRYRKSFLKRTVAALSAALMMVQAPVVHMTAYAAVDVVSDNSVVSGNSVVNDVAAEQIFCETADLPLGYVYIEHAQLSAAQQQNILVEVGKEPLDWDLATLTVLNDESGEKKEISLADFSENVLHFAFDTSDMQAGVYRVTSLGYSYKQNDVLYQGTIDFSEIEGMENVCFGLGVDNPLPQTEFTGYNTDGKQVEADSVSQEELLDINVVSLRGASENLGATAPIAEAVQQATAETLGAEKIVAEKGIGQVSDEAVSSERKIAGSLVVMLDPGHDATHVGARSNGLEEEKLTLKVANYCKEYLEKTYSDVVVYMSRPSEACPYPGTVSGDCNANRVDDAYRKKADVYVSLHFNSTAGGVTTATGSIVFYPNSNYNNDVGSKGATLASKIIEQLSKLGLKNNGIQIRNSENNTLYPDGSLADYYGVIRRSKEYGIPAVIVEHAFLNNVEDAAFLQVEENLEKLGVADALGIAQAYGLSTEEVEFDAEDLQVTEIDGGMGTFQITLKGASPVKRIADVKFKVYPTDNKKKEYTYTALLTDKKTGTYTVTGNVGNHGALEGTYKVIAYAYDAAGKKTQLRSTTFSMKQAAIDTEQMKMTATLSSREKVATIKLMGALDVKNGYFMVYSKAAGEKKAKKYTPEKLANGQWRAKVPIADHKKAGEYVAKAYVESYFGEMKEALAAGFVVEGPTVRKIQIVKMNLNKGTFRVNVRGVESKSGIKSVQVIVKKLDGTKIRKEYKTKKAKAGYYYADIDMKSFKYQYGTYGIYAKVKDGNGINETVAEKKQLIEEPIPVIDAKLKSKHTKLMLSASNLGMGANVKGVRFKVVPVEEKSAAKTYTLPATKNGVYSKTVPVKDFGVSGDYKILTYVKRADGKYKKVGKAKIVTVPEAEGGSVKVKKKSDQANYLTISDIEYKGRIETVRVKAWPVTKKKAKYVYKASLRSDDSYRVVIDSKNHKGVGGQYKYEVIVTAANGIETTLLSGKLTLGKSEAENTQMYAISGTSAVTVKQMMAYYKKYATYPTFYAVSDAPTLKTFCEFYYKECEKEGIRAEVAFAQAMHETNFLRYGGDVGIEQFNFAGIGATGGGAKGNSFESVRIGIRAQVQHLKAYANSEPLNQGCVDPRFSLVKERGCAPYVEWLSIPNNPYGKGWATDPNYAVKLRRMISDLRNS